MCGLFILPTIGGIVMTRKKTQEEFVEEVFCLVGDEYTVLGEYINNKTYIKMKHNECQHCYNVVPYKFLEGKRCPQCFRNYPKTNNQFKKEVYELVRDEYEVLDKYINQTTEIRIRHVDCGFITKYYPRAFLITKSRCPYCKKNMKKINTDIFKYEVSNIVGDEYEVLGEYVNAITNIEIKHSTCGKIYEVAPFYFKKVQRCPFCFCNSSNGEVKIKYYLDKNKINYIPQYSFNDCKYKKKLFFDFSIFNKDDVLLFLIEFDGKQHFEPVDYFGGEENFKQTQIRDELKNQYCQDNNIRLHRIPYWEMDNLDDILTKLLLN